ncbi:MAG: hypothetical protein AAFX50_02785, partial [Acidobacteriota bacterium]
LAIEAAATGRGVVLAKRAIAAADIAAGRLIAPFADGSISVDYGYWLVSPKGRHLTEDVGRNHPLRRQLRIQRVLAGHAGGLPVRHLAVE